MTFDENRNPKLRYRIAHDLFFSIKKGISINDRIHWELLTDIQYIHALHRTLHHIQALLQQNPRGIILITKRDLKDLYRRVHTWAHIVAACMAIVGQFLLPLLRLPFGSSPAPGEFCLSSEMIVDLTNDLLATKNWNETDFDIPYKSKIPDIQEIEEMERDTAALPMEVPVVYKPEGKAGGYVDDMWVVCLNDEENARRTNIALNVAIYTTFRPLADNEPIFRLDPTSISKLIAEGKLEEIKIILGWLINCRTHIISLTPEKSEKWRKEIKKLC